MSLYKYKVLDPSGKALAGLVDAVTEDMAADTLREKGYSIVSLYLESSGEQAKGAFVIDRVKPKDMVIFSRQFSVLISANVAIVQALRILVDQTENMKLKMILSEVVDEIDGGSTLSGSLAKRPKVFDNFFVNIIKSGENSGKLDEVLDYLANEIEKEYDMISKVKGAMIYPAFVMAGLGTVGIVMMVFVVPKLTTVLEESGGELPMATKILIATSSVLQNYWWLIIILLLGAFFGLKAFLRTKVGKTIFDNIVLRLPIFGRLFKLIYLTRFTRSFNTLLIGGVTMTHALKITGDIVNNSVYKNLIDKTIVSIEDGHSISKEFSQSDQIPKMVSQMMSIGEKTGKLDVILEKITEFYTREIDNIVANLMTLMEPIIMVIMGIGVGIMVAAIIMPMYQMAA
ncbi:MAG: type II secretion system F family protein [Patescibacteria group bacterium]|jgi:type IV pilus assembly protein PilC|nr:type II secretion system F family protein [Patescibacteria group bacterium]